MQCNRCDRTLSPEESEIEKNEKAPFCNRCNQESKRIGKPNEVATLKELLRQANIEIEKLNRRINQLTAEDLAFDDRRRA